MIGGSAGSLEPLIKLCQGFKKDLPAAVFVVIHAADADIVSHILNYKGSLPAAGARNGEAIRRGRIYVACADQHMVINHARVIVFHGPRENGFRPAVDALFRTAAVAYGRRVVGVVLSGFLADGTLGLFQIKNLGGTAIVQSPEEATAPSMPLSAIRNNLIDHIVPVSQMAALIDRLARRKVRRTRQRKQFGATSW